MNPRSSLSLRQRGAGILLAVLSLGWPGCAPPDGADLEAAEKQRPGTKGGCEEATPQLLATNVNMLPGRDCGSCHRAGGQATNSPFTIAGTVFADLNAPCNPGGVPNVHVEILDDAGAIQENGILPTNSVGNFYSAFRYTTPLQVRVRQYSAEGPMKGMGTVLKEAVMVTKQGRGSEGNVLVNCASCHQFPGIMAAPGRVFINDTHMK